MNLGITTLPLFKRYLYGVVIGAVIIYAAWSLWGHTPQQPSQGFVTAQPAVATRKVQGPTVAIKIVPKAAVQKKFPGVQLENSEDEVVDTADIGPAPNGATTVTVINAVTGESHTDVQMKEPPWLALERQNYVGIGYELSSAGAQRAKIYYKRDFLRMRDVHLQGSAQLSMPVNGVNGSVEGTVSGNIEYRF